MPTPPFWGSQRQGVGGVALATLLAAAAILAFDAKNMIGWGLFLVALVLGSGLVCGSSWFLSAYPAAETRAPWLRDLAHWFEGTTRAPIHDYIGTARDLLVKTVHLREQVTTWPRHYSSPHEEVSKWVRKVFDTVREISPGRLLELHKLHGERWGYHHKRFEADPERPYQFQHMAELLGLEDALNDLIAKLEAIAPLVVRESMRR